MGTTKNIILKDQYGDTSINQVVSPGTPGGNEIFTGAGAPNFVAPAGSVYFQGDAADTKSVMWVNGPAGGNNWALAATVDTNPNLLSVFQTDFIATIPFATPTGGTASAAQVDDYGVNGTEKAIGVAKVQTGTDNNGRAAMVGGINYLRVGSQALSMGFRSAIQALSDGTDTFTVVIGFFDSYTGSIQNGIYFRYTHSVNGGKWQAVVADNNTIIAADTTVAADLLYSTFEILVNQAGTQAIFKINGVVTNTITVGLPTTARVFNWGQAINKSAGTSNRNLNADWAYFQIAGTGR